MTRQFFMYHSGWPATQDAEAEGSQVQNQPEQLSEALSQNKK